MQQIETDFCVVGAGISGVQVVGAGKFHTNSAVRDIEQHPDHVVVQSETVRVKAQRVIVATSTSAVSFIRFHPPLPPDRAQLQQRMGLGSFWKIWLAYDTPFWRRDGRSGAVVSINKHSYIATTLDSSASDDGPGLLTCFIDADKARAFAHLSSKDRRKTVLKEMAHVFGNDALTLSGKVKFPAVAPQHPEDSAYFEWNWSLPDFIRGDYAGAPGPGVYTAIGFGPAIEAPCGRVHWAGSDNATECYGAMTGAVSSGERAVAEVLHDLSGAPAKN